MTKDYQNGVKEIVNELCKIINESNISRNELLDIITTFLYSLGLSMSTYKSIPSNEKLLKDYAESPNIWNALMVQSIWMKENWNENK